MAYKILILDDDTDFNSLLTDIYEQADYVVSSKVNPTEALEDFKQNEYDLVVTDHKMPDMMGAEFMRRIRKLKPEVPVIMVSGYLENDTIRELISEGVGGVFLKPLNIFSLLERTSELIEETAKMKESGVRRDVNASPGEEGEEPEEALSLQSFPCKSAPSVEFSERLRSLRNFKSTLTLIGGPGTHFRSICEDIRKFSGKEGERFVYFSRGSFDERQALAVLEEAREKGASRVTCVLLEVESMEVEQKRLAAQLPKREGPFEALDMDIRALFCICGDLDALFDEGWIDEELYILMGTAEVKVPSLRDCPEDVPIMAQQMVADIAHKKELPSVPQFEKSASDFLRTRRWERNAAELREVVKSIMERGSGDVITQAAVVAAMEAGPVEKGARAQLEDWLAEMRTGCVHSVELLVGNDAAKIAEFFGSDTNTIKGILE